jgi:hypothetical protein
MIYSPQDQSKYRLRAINPCEFSVIAESPFATATWNLYWMTNPTVDVLPSYTGKGLPPGFKVVADLTPTLMSDVISDTTLQRRLHLAPLQFLSWWNKVDHSVFDTYDLIGPSWPETVRQRAFSAAKQHHVARLEVARWGAKFLGVELPFAT